MVRSPRAVDHILLSLSMPPPHVTTHPTLPSPWLCSSLNQRLSLNRRLGQEGVENVLSAFGERTLALKVAPHKPGLLTPQVWDFLESLCGQSGVGELWGGSLELGSWTSCFQRAEKGAAGMGQRQKSSKSVKNNFRHILIIFTQDKKTSKSVKKKSKRQSTIFNTFRKSRAALVFRPLLGGLWCLGPLGPLQPASIQVRKGLSTLCQTPSPKVCKPHFLW